MCGLFHDMPEVLTRDIISPLNRSVEGLDEMIKDYEKVNIAGIDFWEIYGEFHFTLYRGK